MRRRRLIFLLFIIPTVGYAQRDSTLSIAIENQPIANLFKQIEEKTNYKIYYLNSWIDSLNVTLSPERRTVSSILTEVLANTKLQFYIDENRVIITNNVPIVAKLSPSFFSTAQGNSASAGNFSFAREDIPDQLIQEKKENKIIEIGRKQIGSKKAVNLSGYIKDKKTNEGIYEATDSSGRFYFNIDKPKLDQEMVVRLDSASCADCKIELDSFGLSDYSIFKPSPLIPDSAMKKWIEQESLAVQIENAYYEQKKDSTLGQQVGNFYGKPTDIYRLDDYVRFPRMEDILIEYASEIVLRKKGGISSIRVKNRSNEVAFEEDPLILIDGVPIFDVNDFMNYDPLLVERIEVVGKRYYYGSLELDGIISVITYDGRGVPAVSAVREKFIGIQARRRYVTPDYSNRITNERIPDYRIQLYWSPSIFVKDGVISTDFFTSDVTGDFEVMVEGHRADGKAIYYRDEIHVD